jgi:hypothetical protein
MRLGPNQVRLIAPFLPTLVGRTLRFVGRRNTIDLQETALVVEGDLLLFPCLGLERLFGRALSARTAVTVPYSRLAAVRYRPRRILRLAILALVAGFLALTLQAPWDDPSGMEWAADALILVPAAILAALVWWGIRPTYVIRFRTKDGRRTRLQFAIRSWAVRRQFDAALAGYREAARAYARAEGGR